MTGRTGGDRVPNRPLHYVELAPSGAAREIALAYWGFTVSALPFPGFLHRLWPDGCATLVTVFAGGAPVMTRVAGARTRVMEVPVHPGSHFWGIRLRPETGAAWLGVDAAALRDANLQAGALLGAHANTFGAASVLRRDGRDDANHAAVRAHFDAWVARATRERHPRGFAADALARGAAERITASDGKIAVSALARALAVSPRTLQRHFQGATGLTPKEFATVRRGRAALKRVVNGESSRAAGGWAALADSAGFADQAHLTRELARLTKLPPRALREWLDTIAHEALVD